MKIHLSFFLLLLFIYSNISAQSYNAAMIPDSLLQHANAVKRVEETKIVIHGIDKATIYHTYAITVLNEAGDKYARYLNFYNNLISLNNIHGNLYDANGKLIRSVAQKDIEDYYSEDESTLITDNRFKTYNFYNNQYPYTVEFSDRQEYNGLFFLESWHPQESNVMSVMKSRYIVETPMNFELRYKQLNDAYSPIIQNTGDVKIYTWETRNTCAFESEDFSPSLSDITTAVYLAPVRFKIDGHEGTMDTWKNFGKFVAGLNAGKDALPDNVKQDVHQLTDGLTDNHQKAILLYDYLQKNTRYINVKIGIGGWQPFDATYVATKKYGDCKALSNYLKSLLEEAGITAYYVLVKGSEDDVHGLWEDFPAPYFNHAVLCLPLGKDTTWFECTSQTAAPGFMGAWVGNREALLIKDDGGYVVHTPVYDEKTNLQLRKVVATIDESGNLQANLFTQYTGVEQELPHALINEVNKEFRDRYLNTRISLPSYEVQDVKYVEEKKSIPEVDETLQLTAAHYATVTGKRLFVKPNLINKNGVLLNDEKKRHFPIEYTTAFTHIDSIDITVPEGFTVEAMPKDVLLSNKFGNYSMTVSFTGNIIKVVRIYSRHAGIFPATDFNLFADFNNTIYKADRGQLVLVKK